MNHSFYSADRMTHLKIVVVALVAAILAGIAAGLGLWGLVLPPTAGTDMERVCRFPALTRLMTELWSSMAGPFMKRAFNSWCRNLRCKCCLQLVLPVYGCSVAGRVEQGRI